MSYTDPYEDPFQYEDPLEYKDPFQRARAYGNKSRQMAEQLRGIGVNGIRSPNQLASEQAYIDSSQDLSSRENDFDRQIAFAQEMRGRAMPQGKAVGPSGIYTVNLWEQGAAAIERALGGYAEGAARRRKEKELGPLREAVARARGEVSRGEAMQGVSQFNQGLEADAAEAEAGRIFDAQQAKAAAEAAAQAATTKYEREVALEGVKAENNLNRDAALEGIKAENDAAKDWDLLPYMKGGRQMNISFNPSLKKFHLGTPDGPELSWQEVSALTPYVAGEEGSSKDSMSAALMEARREAILSAAEVMPEMNSVMSDMRSVLVNPETDRFTGNLSVPRFLGLLGIGEDAWRAQTIDQKIRSLALSHLAAVADIFKPMSDADLKFLAEGFPESSNDPRAIVAFMATKGKARLAKLAREGRVSFIGDEELAKYDARIAQAMNQFDGIIAQGAVVQGMSDADAAQYGLNKADVSLVRRSMCEQNPNAPYCQV